MNLHEYLNMWGSLPGKAPQHIAPHHLNWRGVEPDMELIELGERVMHFLENENVLGWSALMDISYQEYMKKGEG